VGHLYSTSARTDFPNFENPASLMALEEPGLSLSFGYSPSGLKDILNYGQNVKLKNLTSINFFTKGSGFSYRPLAHRKLEGSNFEEEFSIHEFQLLLSELLYYNVYGGLSLKYLYVRYAFAGVDSGVPKVDLETGHGFSVNLGMLFDYKSFSLGAYLQNVLSAVYYPEHEKDKLPLQGGMGLCVNAFNFLSFSSDVILSEHEKADYVLGLSLKPFKWAILRGGFSLSRKDFGFGLEFKYRGSSFVISYRKGLAYITGRSLWYE